MLAELFVAATAAFLCATVAGRGGSLAGDTDWAHRLPYLLDPICGLTAPNKGQPAVGDSASLARPPLEPGRAAGILPGSCYGARLCAWRCSLATPAFRKLLFRGCWATLQLPAHKRQNLPHPHHGCRLPVHLLHNLLFPVNLAKGQSSCTSLLEKSQLQSSREHTQEFPVGACSTLPPGSRRNWTLR